MAVLPDYVTGTITLANGSTTVTGTGTMFTTAAFRPGDTLQIQNLTAVIASVDSNTQLTLADPWTGTGLTDAPYRARYLPDGARVTAQTTLLIELLGNGVLSNIASIPVEEGNLLIGNAAGLYDLIDKSELGTPDPNGSLAKLAALTLAARQILQTDETGALTALTLGARQILQTDETGALKSIALAASKLLNTDANGDVLLSDITTYGRSVVATANATALRTVTGSDRPIFSAYPPADISIGNGINAVNMTATHVNVGNHWNGSRFLCPEAGNYLFSFSAQWNVGQDNTGYAILRIKRNGTTVIGGIENKSLYFKHVTITSVIPLTVGDTVTFEFELVNAAGSPLLQGSNTRAHGFLVR
ncbi:MULTISPECIES: C1q-like domain-containing protein [Brucella]|uniref:C1q-like domain-containing protein n=1 Tax=Brucella TaxID=234 RepID=UPI00124E6240|nr:MULTISPECIES: hypothetical protein [Brucella]KAB2747851.1 hypothetical protein F9L05_14515 [Brucella anthropi]UYT54167.1 hypothetical protein OHI65_07240 [Brucella sp. MAB-22]